MKRKGLPFIIMALFIFILSACNSGTDEAASKEEEKSAPAEETESVEVQEERDEPQ